MQIELQAVYYMHATASILFRFSMRYIYSMGVEAQLDTQSDLVLAARAHAAGVFATYQRDTAGTVEMDVIGRFCSEIQFWPP